MSDERASWGAGELVVGFVLAFLTGIVYHRAAGGEIWAGEYLYAGASAVLLLIVVPVAFSAPSFKYGLIRVGVPFGLMGLFYSASMSSYDPLLELQSRLSLPHFLLLFGASFFSIIFTSDSSEMSISAPAPEAEPMVQESERMDDRVQEDPFERIVGQDHVIGSLREIANIARSGIRVGKSNAPHAVLLFIGPTGVGKTEVAMALAETVYGSKYNMVRFDMGQFTDASQANRFYGPPPGFVGSEHGGQLTRAVKEKPESVVLLDEMEKANPKIWDAFLPVFDEGYIVDGSTNEKVDMTGTIIVLTSNLLARDSSIASLDAHQLKEKVTQTGVLRPELVGRINEILVFKPLELDSITEILRRRLDHALWSLAEQGIRIHVEEREIQQMVSQVQRAQYGVRQIDDVVRKYLRKAIAEHKSS